MIDEHTLKNSFRAIKADILTIQGELLGIKQEQARILVDLEIMKSDRKNQKRIVTKTVVSRPKKMYVASKEGKKFHMSKCPYAQNIKSKSRVRFGTKDAALNKGYKPCNCVK
jgi:hypothetical protein